MKIAFLAAHTSVHTIKWVNEMARRGHETHLITMHPGSNPLDGKVIPHLLPIKAPIGYYTNASILKKLLWKIQPDILNTHFASGYGTLSRWCGFHPNILSVYGSDVFDFPFEAKWKFKLIQKNILAADRVSSTSWVMKRQTESIQNPAKEIVVTPFGVDCEKFAPQPKMPSKKLRIGTVKKMAPKYGITDLIRAFSIAKLKGLNEAELCLVGDGPQLPELKNFVKKLGLEDSVLFVGPVLHADVPKWLNTFDIFAALSTKDSESFGVAVVEASACELPVLVSNVGGLPEVVIEGETGFVVPKHDPRSAADKIIQLAKEPNLRKLFGKNGREMVLKKYEWSQNADIMEQLYFATIQ
jgi:L-malate glycosyltransferase